MASTITNFSSVLGGSGNTISAAYQYAGILGQNVSAVANYTFHVNCLNAVNTPLAPGLFPPGTIAYTPSAAALPAGALGFLVIY